VMQEAFDPIPSRKFSRSLSTFIALTLVLLTLGALALLNGEAANAQNIDEGKPPPRLFADSCATCHHSPRGLAKGRFRLTLFAFLREHYSANSSSAWALTSYLESVDTPQQGKSRAAGAKPSSRASRSSPLPPAPVPTR
jgi:mono/diheme cytochrome c family protein